MQKTEFTLNEVSKDYDFSMRELKKYINRGWLVAHKTGATYRVRADDLEEFLDSVAERSMRNYYCKHYDECLNEAAHANCQFTCSGCKCFAPAEKQIITDVELLGILSLWRSVFGSSISIH